jgi:glutaryl-CoA dehydrogenase
MEDKVAPVITQYWVDDSFPFELLPRSQHSWACTSGWRWAPYIWTDRKIRSRNGCRQWRFEKCGCFGLTEPLVGSGNSGGMTTTAKRVILSDKRRSDHV